MNVCRRHKGYTSYRWRLVTITPAGCLRNYESRHRGGLLDRAVQARDAGDFPLDVQRSGDGIFWHSFDFLLCDSPMTWLVSAGPKRWSLDHEYRQGSEGPCRLIDALEDPRQRQPLDILIEREELAAAEAA